MPANILDAGGTPPEPEHVLAEGRPALLWRPDKPWLAISSGVYGGGLGSRRWVLNTTVCSGYDRQDPHEHVAELAADLGLHGAGVGLLTAVDVRRVVSASDSGVTASVTTGVGHPIWAAEYPESRRPEPGRPAPERHAAHAGHSGDGYPGDGYPGDGRAPAPVAGTINVVCWLPTRLSEGALVNAVATVAEAKAQALSEAGVPGTGTCTDATVLLCPPDGPAQPYGGPRSPAGGAVARSVHAAVTAGLGVAHPRYTEC